MCRPFQNKVLRIAFVLVSIATMSSSAFAQAKKGFMMAPTSTAQLVADISRLADQGANLVRLPIYLDASSLESRLELLKSVMPTVVSRGMTAVIDFHMPNRGRRTFVVDSPAQFIADWKVIATTFRGYPSNSVWYELGNEQENTPQMKWRDLATKTALAIRQIDTGHPICFSPTGVTTSPAPTFRKLDGISNQILTFHFYGWQTTPSVQGEFGRVPYPSPFRTKADLQRLLLEVQMTSIRERCPVYISEVAIHRDHKNAARFLRDFTQMCRESNIHLTIHAYREYPAWSYEGTPAWPEIQAWLKR